MGELLIAGELYEFLFNSGDYVKIKITQVLFSKYEFEVIESSYMSSGGKLLISKDSMWFDSEDVVITRIWTVDETNQSDEITMNDELKRVFLDLALLTKDKKWFTELMNEKGVTA